MPTPFPPKGDADKKIGAYAAPLSVTAQDTPNMTVKVRAGAYFNGVNEYVEYQGGTSAAITLPVGTPKWVVVGVTNSGTLTLINGTPASLPSLPVVPAGVLALAAVYVTPTTTAITPPLIIDVRPFLRTIDVVADLAGELADRPTVTDMNNALALKADVAGTPVSTFTLNSDFTSGSPGADAKLAVSRGAAPEVAIRWNESVDLWELTNDGVVYSPIASVAGTFAPIVHTHVAADITNFTSAVDALIALAVIPQSQVTGLVSDLAAKASTATLTSHTSNAAIHFTLPIAQADVTGLTAALAGKAGTTGGTFTGNVTAQGAGFQPITLASVDAGSSGLLVDRTSVPGPSARFEWDESLDSWLIGTTGSMNTVLTGAVVASKVDTTTQVIAGTGLSGGGALSGNVTLSLPSTGTPVANAAVKVTTDVQGRVSATSALTVGDIGAAAAVHTHTLANVTDVTATVAEINKSDTSVETQTIAEGDVVSPSLRVTQIASTAPGAVTLAVPNAAMLGLTKVIEMTVDTGDVTLATTNIVGIPGGGATATFAAVGDVMVLVGGVAAWVWVGGNVVVV